MDTTPQGTGILAAPRVTVIIPVYNCEDWLQRSIDSVYAQTFQDFEIIAINDGSTDGSTEILRTNAAQKRNFTLIEQENRGQGIARNRAIGLARGEFIQFLDSDDFLDPSALEVTIGRADRDNSDLVHFDWKTTSLIPERPATFNYFNNEPYWHKGVLENRECSHLVRMGSYFTVNNLYRREFLNKWNIRYDEDHIYEDIPFMIQVASRAERVSLLQSPLYVVQQNPTSTTKSDTHTDKHFRGHIHAMKLSFEMLEERVPYSREYLMRYHLQKFLVYRQRRVPLRYRRAYTRTFIDEVSRHLRPVPNGVSFGERFDFCLEREIFSQKRVTLLGLMALANDRVGPFAKRMKPQLVKLRKAKQAGKLGARDIASALAKPPIFVHPSIEPGLIVFLGFDWRYAGNSRALYEQLAQDPRFAARKILFITNDEQVSAKDRLRPGSPQANDAVHRAELVIAESWIPGTLKKNPDSIWVQLWHGTPFKKVLFDSTEPDIVKRRPNHKIAKYQDTLRWDYLVVDSPSAARKFETALLFPRERMIPSGYPRVRALLESPDSEHYLELLKERVRIPRKFQKRKIVLYAPTWRDYNYGLPASKKKFRYMADLKSLSGALGEDYVVVFHDHAYMQSAGGKLGANCVDASSADIQDLLKIADVLVSDYSSVVFDAIAIDLPFALYTSDLPAFERSRGVYPDMLRDFYPNSSNSLAGIVQLVQNADRLRLSDDKKKKYSYDNQVDLVNFVAGLKLEDLGRDW